MIRIDSRWMNEYRSTLSTIENSAQQLVEQSILEYAALNPEASIEELRDFGETILQQVFENYGDLAGKASAEMYDQIMAALGADVPIADIENVYINTHDNATEQAHFQATKLLKYGIGAFAEAMGKVAKDHVKATAQRTTMANANRDKDKGVKYAVVPQGIETCGYCIVLASRGFVYTEKRLSTHDHCDCAIVPGYDDTQVDGYDVNHYMAIYSAATDVAGSTDMSALQKVIDDGDVDKNGSEVKRYQEMYEARDREENGL